MAWKKRLLSQARGLQRLTGHSGRLGLSLRVLISSAFSLHMLVVLTETWHEALSLQIMRHEVASHMFYTLDGVN